MSARPFALVLCLALATAAVAATPPQYSQVRQEMPGIDDAVAALPNSDFHGTINRLSALWNRAQISDLAAGTGTAGQLPENFLRNIDATLADLAADMDGDVLAGLTDVQALNILWVIEKYGFQRTRELYQGQNFCVGIPCGSGELPNCCFAEPNPVYTRLDQVLAEIKPAYNRARAAAGNPAGSAANLNGNNIGTSLPPLMLVLGVESIDD